MATAPPGSPLGMESDDVVNYCFPKVVGWPITSGAHRHVAED
jgi:hypothetical protein